MHMRLMHTQDQWIKATNGRWPMADGRCLMAGGRWLDVDGWMSVGTWVGTLVVREGLE